MSRTTRILVIDDEPAARTALACVLRNEGFAVETAADAFKALAKRGEHSFDVVVTDLRMPGMDGVELIRRTLADDPELAIIVVTAFGSASTAAEALRAGAVDYLLKPVDVDHLIEVIEREGERARLRGEQKEAARDHTARRGLRSLVGGSRGMLQITRLIETVAPTQSTVLISGESGTGKELAAEALHALSPRFSRPLVKLHCAALAPGLLESELFGHERGAFTGAAVRRDGRFQQADGGTLFLDEIGEINPSTQIKLLRVLQEREIQRVGGNETIPVDVRIIAATNRDLRQMVADGRFREDLYYRLHVIELHMPPLRERQEDIPLLAAHMLRELAATNQRTIAGFTDDALQALTSHPWPGNVRELQNVLERAVVLCRGDVIGVDDLALVRDKAALPALPPIPGTVMAELERDAILRTLEEVGGSTTRAAKLLGISARMIQYRLRTWRASERRGH